MLLYRHAQPYPLFPTSFPSLLPASFPSFFSEHRALVEQLEEVDPSALSEPERVAFWVNLYNALLMHVSTTQYYTEFSSGLLWVNLYNAMRNYVCTIQYCIAQDSAVASWLFLPKSAEIMRKYCHRSNSGAII